MRKLHLICLYLSFLPLSIISQTKEDIAVIQKESNTNHLEAISKLFDVEAKANKERALQLMKTRKLQEKIYHEDGNVSELIGVTADMRPIYYITENIKAAKSTRANYLNSGGGLRLNLDGQNMTAYIWDENAVRSTHQELKGRVSIGDGSTGMSNHATHVAGTMIASGKDPKAKGMASQAKVISNNWNSDASKAATAATNGMTLSNHSYGFRFSSITPWMFGAYSNESKSWDEIMFNAPFYLMVCSAGNDGYATNPNPLATGYDKLSGFKTSKNNLVVANAENIVIDANGKLAQASINGSSSQGPTDDLRIKPDIAGNGTEIYSSVASSDVSYATYTGTSMASPNVTGTLILLQQHYKNLYGTLMKAATLKGLALHTADDAGTPGPDAKFGWGLLNAKFAAETISKKNSNSLIEENILTSGSSYSITVNSDGINPLIASISWTDPAGNVVNSGTINLSTAVLVNDLDIRITKNGTTYYPYLLTSATTSSKGDNKVDPFERIDIPGASGSYTISIKHKNNLSGGKQNYSLIVTGIIKSNCSAPTGLKAERTTSSGTILKWNAIAGAGNYTVEYKKASSASWSVALTNDNSYTLTGLQSDTSYDWRIKANCSSGSSSNYSQSNFKTLTVVSCIQNYEPNESFTTAAPINTNTNYYAGIGSATDKDYYKFTISAVSNIVATLANLPKDYDLKIYNSSFIQIGSSTKSGTSSESITLNNLPAGTYYVLVYGYNGNFDLSQCYHLKVSTTPVTSSCINNYEPNESFATAVALRTNTTYSAGIGSATDKDYYKFILGSKSNINITLQNLPKDYDLKLYNSSKTQIGSSTFSGTTNETIAMNNLAPGTYYILVYGHAGNFDLSKCYNLRINVSSTNASNAESELANPNPENTFISPSLYPNPVENTLFIKDIKYSSNEVEVITITDRNGRVVKTATVKSGSEITLDVSELPSNLYFLRIQDYNFKFFKK
ncbi:S8 family serine peptidase [Apibacter sp. HY039]|uniref:S8 family serine peptidase n=1 Tax=Apibacter sp. HY039 TaxID=2501476 RepID=UPI000FEC1409|nr:S8 family serine peptidase [Apibacter sp. HY039]